MAALPILARLKELQEAGSVSIYKARSVKRSGDIGVHYYINIQPKKGATESIGALSEELRPALEALALNFAGKNGRHFSLWLEGGSDIEWAFHGFDEVHSEIQAKNPPPAFGRR